MKKILLYTDTPQVGGAELQMFLLTKFLNKEKYAPILCCSTNEKLDEWCQKFDNEGIEVIRIKVKGKHDPRHLTKLRRIIKEKEIDIIHAHVWNPASCRYVFPAAKSSKAKLIITEHDPFKLSLIKDVFKKSALKQVDRIVAVSEKNKDTLCELYPNQREKISVVYNGIDTTWWQSQLLSFNNKDRTEIKEKIFHARENTLIITCVGELHERKGLESAIKCIPELAKKFPNIKLVIIGGGKEEKNLKALVKKLKIQRHVTLTGKQKQIPKLLRASDIFLLPSRREAFGFVNLEAMICELPIVANRVGGVPEIVSEKSGIIVEAGDQQKMTKALEILIESEEIREKLGQEGKKRVLKNFSAEHMCQEYEKIYKQT